MHVVTTQRMKTPAMERKMMSGTGKDGREKSESSPSERGSVGGMVN